ncbi:MAG TPA: SpoVA/SpoVAEb family sporulation membrane protein [Candidatus Onthoplasma faecipullorum]|nr:SpoVA/SpoVAEb family sporulation membrane protein [Candidatus Onthoplasma faecipullorum]
MINIWDYVVSFLVGGFICFLAQILVIRTKITTARILVLFLIIGMILELFNVYAPFREFAKAGASVPIIGFGATLARGAITAAQESGFIGVFTGGLSAAAGGIAMAIFASFIFALIFNSKTKRGGH